MIRGYMLPATSRPVMTARPQRLRGLRGLGDGYPFCTDIDPATGVMYGSEQGVYCTTPQPEAGPVPASLQNILTAAQPPQDPLSYVSPQAAIAAGLDPNKVYDAWTKGLAVFPTASAAISAGVPAGVVTQLFAASRSYVAPPTSWLDQNKWLLLAGGVGLLLVMKRR